MAHKKVRSSLSKDDSDGGLFDSRTQSFAEPALERLYQKYLIYATDELYKVYLSFSASLDVLYGIWQYLGSSPGDRFLRYGYIFLFYVNIPVDVLVLMILFIGRPKWLVQQKTSLVITVLFLFGIASGVVKSAFDLREDIDTFQQKLATLTVNSPAYLLLIQRPFTSMLTPDPFQLGNLHIMQSEMHAPLVLRTILTWLIPLANICSQLYFLPPALYSTSGVFVGATLYFTCVIGALFSGLSNDRFLRRNFYVAYMRMSRLRRSASSIVAPMRGNTATFVLATVHSSTIGTDTSSDALQMTGHCTDDEMVREIVKLLGGTREMYAKMTCLKGDHWNNNMIGRSIRYLIHSFGNFFYRHILLTWSDQKLEARIQERELLRICSTAKRTFTILLASYSFTLLSVIFQPLYQGFRAETELRVAIAVTLLGTGLLLSLTSPERLSPLVRQSLPLIYMFLLLFISCVNYTICYVFETDANRIHVDYLLSEISVEYLILLIAMATLLRTKYVALFQSVVILWLGLLQLLLSFDISSTLIYMVALMPWPIILAAMTERQRRLHLHPDWCENTPR